MKELRSKLDQLYENVDGLYYNKSFSKGYWSNLSKKEQTVLLRNLERDSTRNIVNKLFPRFGKIIFDPMRAVGLRLLEIKEHEVGVDYGCMWGNLLIYCAKNCRSMLGVDQTQESLEFVKYRLKEENLFNCYLLNTNLRENLPLKETFDFAIVNGVLEWMPDENDVELNALFRKSKSCIKKHSSNPKLVQLEFLRMVYSNLKPGGKLYLAIENRYDYQYFLWKKDPHSNLFYTAFLPRRIANLISNAWYGRPYVNYLYSINELEKLTKEAGFSEVEKYAAFPDYRYPQKIIPVQTNMENNFKSVYMLRSTHNILKRGARKIRKILDWVIYKKLGLFSLAPSFIYIARKSEN